MGFVALSDFKTFTNKADSRFGWPGFNWAFVFISEWNRDDNRKPGMEETQELE